MPGDGGHLEAMWLLPFAAAAVVQLFAWTGLVELAKDVGL
jgi:hypothetical protein